MYQILGEPRTYGPSYWQARRHWPGDEEEGLRILFKARGRLDGRKMKERVRTSLVADQVDWLDPDRDVWSVDFARLRVWLAEHVDRIYPQPFAKTVLDDAPWMTGIAQARVETEHEQQPLKPANITWGITTPASPNDVITYLRLEIPREEFELDKKTKIFLSHKHADKPMVRRFYALLEELGYSPWLDEENMPAGTETQRGLLRGMEESCAAVFFITEHFKDERFLGKEIDYAISQKMEKGERFSIVTLVFDAQLEEKIKVPSLLTHYVWKHPETELDGMREIVRALPIVLGKPRWRVRD